MASVEYLIALAFYAQEGAPAAPSESALDAFADLLERRYHALIRAQLGGFRVDTQTLAYVSALAALSPQRTAESQVRAACAFFKHVKPRLPDVGLLAFAALPTNAALLPGGGGVALTPLDATAPRAASNEATRDRGRPAGKKGATKKGVAKKGVGKKGAAKKGARAATATRGKRRRRAARD
jgi:hypothetical protein